MASSCPLFQLYGHLFGPLFQLYGHLFGPLFQLYAHMYLTIVIC